MTSVNDSGGANLLLYFNYGGWRLLRYGKSLNEGPLADVVFNSVSDKFLGPLFSKVLCRQMDNQSPEHRHKAAGSNR
jgi:hypothetical protein